MRIVVLGYIVRGPMGGMAWHHLQYVLGLARLGHDVYFLEDSEDYPSCYDPSVNAMGDDPTYGLKFAADAFVRLGLGELWAYYDAPRRRWLGPAGGKALEICRTADVLVNVSGVNPLRTWTEQIPIRVFIDTDPVFVQARHLRDPRARAMAAKHNAFFSFGENVLNVRGVADDGFAWRATRQPVVLDCWTPATHPPREVFTTVMQWDSYAPVEIGGRGYGMKSTSFPPYLDLPSRFPLALELAIGEAPAALADAGWRTRNVLEIARDPWTYRAYLADSFAEFSVAKHGYVAASSGWFSERSANYLASGRPVLVQETGFSEWLELGRGVLAFTDPDEALDGAQRIVSDYRRQCAWAREAAGAYFDSSQVLTHLLDAAVASAAEPSG